MTNSNFDVHSKDYYAFLEEEDLPAKGKGKN